MRNSNTSVVRYLWDMPAKQPEKHVLFECRGLREKQIKMLEAINVALGLNATMFEVMPMPDKLAVLLGNQYELLPVRDAHTLADIANSMSEILQTVDQSI